MKKYSKEDIKKIFDGIFKNRSKSGNYHGWVHSEWEENGEKFSSWTIKTEVGTFTTGDGGKREFDKIFQDEIENYLKSEQFKKDFQDIVEQGTWDKGLPKIYMDKEGNIVEHWKSGEINILKTKEELKEKGVE